MKTADEARTVFSAFALLIAVGATAFAYAVGWPAVVANNGSLGRDIVAIAVGALTIPFAIWQRMVIRDGALTGTRISRVVAYVAAAVFGLVGAALVGVSMVPPTPSASTAGLGLLYVSVAVSAMFLGFDLSPPEQDGHVLVAHQADAE